MKFVAYILARIINIILYILAIIFFPIYGWKVTKNFDKNSKGVCLYAPHTSNWDAFWAALYISRYILPSPIRVAYKREFVTSDFLSSVLISLGGIPVYRKNVCNFERKDNLLQKFINDLKKLKKGFVMLTPEATRKATPKWNKGFYLIASKAEVPIYLCKIDYKKKEIGIYKKFFPTGNYELDLKEISEFYKDVNPKHPEKFALPTQYSI